jgi:hypothetical protein
MAAAEAALWHRKFSQTRAPQGLAQLELAAIFEKIEDPTILL